MTHLSDLPAIALAELIKRREVSAVEVLEATLERIQQVDGQPGSLEPGWQL